MRAPCPNRLELTREERLAFLNDRSTRRPLSFTQQWMFWQRRLDQTCPDCGRHEAAGDYCSGCYLPMSPADWYDRRASQPVRITFSIQLTRQLRDARALPEDELPEDMRPDPIRVAAEERAASREASAADEADEEELDEAA